MLPMTMRTHRIAENRYMNDLQFWVVFNSISVTQGQKESDNEGCVEGSLVFLLLGA